MRTWLLVAACLLVAFPATAQRHKLTINAETPEGQMLQQIGQEEDAAKKLGLMEQFAGQYPKHEAMGWVYAQMVPGYAAASQFDKAMDAAEKLIALDPEDVEIAHAALKAAEAKKDPDAVKKWAALASDTARKAAASKKGDDEEDEDYKRRIDFAKQVDTYTEYSLYAMALQTPDPRKTVDLAETLAQRNPQSQYVTQITNRQFQAYLQAGDVPKAIAFAEKILEKDQSNEEMLLAVAGSYRGAKKDPDKVAAYCAKAIETAAGKPKPQGVSDADWEKRKTQITGRARYIAGADLYQHSQFVQADQELRKALPDIKDDQQMTAEVLFYLGVSNYRLGEKGDTARIKDALAFSEQCAAIKSPYQPLAQRNIKAIRSQYRFQ